MADGNTDLLKQILDKLDEQGKDIKTLKDTQQEQGTEIAGLRTEIASMDTKITAIRTEHGAKLNDLELKIEVIIANQQKAAEQAKKDHMELMAHVIDAADQSSDAVHALEKRVDRIEKHLNLPPVK